MRMVAVQLQGRGAACPGSYWVLFHVVVLREQASWMGRGEAALDRLYFGWSVLLSQGKGYRWLGLRCFQSGSRPGWAVHDSLSGVSSEGSFF